jgi:YD repeat-containing protein
MKIMMLGVLLIGASLCAQTENTNVQGPVYDQAGRFIHYGYDDGTSENYFYDSSSRMTKFVDRQGRVTTYVYGKDGSMSVVNPDGSIQNR